MRLLLAVVIASLPLLAATAQAQPRDFKCIGAERLEDDVFEVPFPARSARPADAARTPVAAAAELAKAQPERNICVLGFAGREGGQSSATQLAARRAREVAEMLSVSHGIARDRIRAEARNPGFSRSTENREARSVTIVVLPDLGATRAAPPAPERAAPPSPAPAAPPAPPRAAPPDTVPAEPPAATPPATQTP
ncbi:OmpA family protein [Pseudoroseomonas ludipueritiae]